MKKLFLSILVICSLLGGNAYAEIRQIEKGKVKFFGSHGSSWVTTFYVRLFSIVNSREILRIMLSTAKEERDGKSPKSKD